MFNYNKQKITYIIVLGLNGILMLLFIILALINAIDWSWIWALFPIGYGFYLFFGHNGLLFGFIIILMIIAILLININKKRINYRNKK